MAKLITRAGFPHPLHWLGNFHSIGVDPQIAEIAIGEAGDSGQDTPYLLIRLCAYKAKLQPGSLVAITYGRQLAHRFSYPLILNITNTDEPGIADITGTQEEVLMHQELARATEEGSLRAAILDSQLVASPLLAIASQSPMVVLYLSELHHQPHFLETHAQVDLVINNETVFIEELLGSRLITQTWLHHDSPRVQRHGNQRLTNPAPTSPTESRLDSPRALTLAERSFPNVLPMRGRGAVLTAIARYEDKPMGLVVTNPQGGYLRPYESEVQLHSGDLETISSLYRWAKSQKAPILHVIDLHRFDFTDSTRAANTARQMSSLGDQLADHPSPTATMFLGEPNGLLDLQFQRADYVNTSVVQNFAEELSHVHQLCQELHSVSSIDYQQHRRERHDQHVRHNMELNRVQARNVERDIHDH